jgi:hypothetical protein
MRRRRRGSSAFLTRPALTIRKPIPATDIITVSECSIGFLPFLSPRVRMRLEVQLATAAIGYVRVELGGGEIGMSQHLLDAPKIGPALEEVRRERVPEQVRMDPRGLEAGAAGEAPEDEERACSGQRTALRVEEELRTVAPVEVRPAAGEVAAKRLCGLAADRDDALLLALADAADEAVVERDGASVE